MADQANPAPIALEDLVHVGPETLCGQFLRRFWHPVEIADRMKPGTARPLKILGEDFTLYRGESGRFYAVAFRCAHRGTQLSTGWVEGDRIRCFYHGWQYDGQGRCIEQPDERRGLAATVTIRSYPAEEYLGLVFVYFGEDPTPLPRFHNFEPSPESYVYHHTYSWPCSFVNSMENDSYHGNWVHRASYAAIGRLPAKGEQVVTVEETDYGMVSHIARNNVRSFQQTDRHILMPNINYRRASNESADDEEVWSEAMNWRVPIDDARFVTYIINNIHGSEAALDRYRERRAKRREAVRGQPSAIAIAEQILRGETSFEHFPGRLPGASDPRLFAIGDYISQVGQGPFGLLQDEHLGRTDVEVALFRRIYRRELTALAEGRPLKQWSVPEWISVRVSED